MTVALIGSTLQPEPLSAQTPASSAIRRTFATIPFENLTGRAEDAWLGRGIADLVATVIAQRTETTLVGLDWTPPATSPSSGEPDPTAAGLSRGAELGIDLLVAGAYERLGDRLHVAARVIRVDDGTAVARASADGAVDDLFAIQDRVALALAESLTAPGAPRGHPSERERSGDAPRLPPGARPRSRRLTR